MRERASHRFCLPRAQHLRLTHAGMKDVIT